MNRFIDNLADAVEQAPTIIRNRIARVDLDKNKCYTQVKKVGGKHVEEYVGKFVGSYRMGSGDGMTVHLEFNDGGRITRVDEEMWGSITGEELSYFVEAFYSSNT